MGDVRLLNGITPQGWEPLQFQLSFAHTREPVPWTQDLLRSRGHAIECRVYAEDPTNDFLPQAGRVLLYREPTDSGIRLDAGVREGSAVPVQYDPLLVKLIAAGETRRWARQRAADALRRYAILGVRANLSLLQRVLEHPRFVTADIATGFLDDEREALVAECSSLPRVAAVAAAAAHQVRSVSDL